MSVTAVHHTETIEIKLRSDGIAEIHSRPEMQGVFTLEQMKENVNQLRELTVAHSLFLVFITNGKYSRESRKYLSQQKDLAAKIGMIAVSPYQTLIGNFFLGIYRPEMKIKLFTSSEKAVEWLLS
jgi:hypothetical protein